MLGDIWLLIKLTRYIIADIANGHHGGMVPGNYYLDGEKYIKNLIICLALTLNQKVT
jgi:hypothetical protein